MRSKWRLLLSLLSLSALPLLYQLPAVIVKADLRSVSAYFGQNLDPATAAPPLQSLQVINFSSITWPRPCGQQPLLLIGIPSLPKEFAARRLRRRLYCSSVQCLGLRTRCIFVLGSAASADEQRRLDAEAAASGDILQRSFVDTYRNLTAKTLILLHWMLSACPSAAFLLKTDMDSYVNVLGLLRLLTRQQAADVAEGLYGGRRYVGYKPLRNTGLKKWRLSQHEYPNATFPPYASGLGYIVSRVAAEKILNASLSIPIISLEDAYIGVCAKQAALKVTDFPGSAFLLRRTQPLLHRANTRAVAVHRVNDAEQRILWQQTRQQLRSFQPKCLVLNSSDAT